MAMLDVNGSSQLLVDTQPATWLGLRVGNCSALSPHSSNEPGELSQWIQP